MYKWYVLTTVTQKCYHFGRPIWYRPDVCLAFCQTERYHHWWCNLVPLLNSLRLVKRLGKEGMGAAVDMYMYYNKGLKGFTIYDFVAILFHLMRRSSIIPTQQYSYNIISIDWAQHWQCFNIYFHASHVCILLLSNSWAA